jgi:hypothetical protein
MKQIHTRNNIESWIIELRNLPIRIVIIGARKKVAMLSFGKYKQFFLNTFKVFKFSNEK